MNKIKKVFLSISVFFTGIISKVYAIEPFQMVLIESLYGVYEPTLGEKISRVAKIVLPVLLFIIGLFVILSKKITKKIKLIVISSLALVGIIGMFVIIGKNDKKSRCLLDTGMKFLQILGIL